jgi:hypothetical protein
MATARSRLRHRLGLDVDDLCTRNLPFLEGAGKRRYRRNVAPTHAGEHHDRTSV